MTKKWLALLTALFMLLALFSACATEPVTEPNQGNTAIPQTEPTRQTIRQTTARRQTIPLSWSPST